MAWKQSSNKPMKLGEIPHKKQISDDELKNLRANAPDRESREAADMQRQHEEQILADIVDQGEKHEKAVMFLIDFFNLKNQYTGHGIFLDDFIVDLSNELQHSSDVELKFDEVLDIAYKLNLKPFNFYFGIDIQDKVTVVFVPIIVWDQRKHWDDRDLEDFVVPSWLSKLHRAQFKIEGDMTPAKARKELIKIGFLENHDIIA